MLSLIVMKRWRRFPLKLSDRRPLATATNSEPALLYGEHGPFDPLARSSFRRAHRFEPAWGSPGGLTGRAPCLPHARAPSGVCVLDSIV